MSETDKTEKEEKQNKSRELIGSIVAIGAIVLIFMACIVLKDRGNHKIERPISGEIMGIEQDKKNKKEIADVTETPEPTEEPWSFVAERTEDTASFPDSVVSANGVLIDIENGTMLAEKGAKKKIYPASMTKIMTVLVAAEHVTKEQMEEKVTITSEITDYCYVNDCSNVGFAKNEKVPVKDLFYGTILPSGADAAMGLVNYVAGSEKEFVKLMNEKAEELGIADTTHFANCVGIYDDNNYSTTYDMAVILKAASENELCQKVLNARTYTTTSTKQHKDGIVISNLFLRRIEDKYTNGEVLYAKTGFVNQSGSCAASMATDGNGKTYLCVTVGSTSSWRCIYDHVDLYNKFLPKKVKDKATDQR